MSYNYINGYNVSKLQVFLNSVLQETFTFPIENIAGKKEVLQDDIIEHRLITGEIKQHFKGTHIVWDIPFEEWASLQVMNIMKELRKYRSLNLGYQFILEPNIDVVPKRTFDVLLSNEKINLGIESANVDAPFNTGVMFSFISRFYVDENWIDKNVIPILNLRNFKFIAYS
jgi:hypothetical protein